MIIFGDEQEIQYQKIEIDGSQIDNDHVQMNIMCLAYMSGVLLVHDGVIQ